MTKQLLQIQYTCDLIFCINNCKSINLKIVIRTKKLEKLIIIKAKSNSECRSDADFTRTECLSDTFIISSHSPAEYWQPRSGFY